MRVHVECQLSCQAAAVWQAVITSDLLRYVSWPWITFHPVDKATLPATWQSGETVRVKLRLLGLVPLGVRTLYFESVDADQRTIQTRESDALVRKWDHHICVAPSGPTQAKYSDDIEIDAGWLTLPVWIFAQAFYRHRRRRWRRFVRCHASHAL